VRAWLAPYSAGRALWDGFRVGGLVAGPVGGTLAACETACAVRGAIG
jgi:hypothetical protein